MQRIEAGVVALIAASATALLPAATAAQGAAAAGTTTRTATFLVSVMVDNDCLISNSNALDFGHITPRLSLNLGALLDPLDQVTQFSVICSRNTRYTLYLDQGSAANSTVGRRLMSGASAGNTDQLQYQLYLDPAFASIWGSGASGSAGGVSGIGSGGAQSYTVYGRILPQVMPSADLYSSMITASLTF
jgi:spore coat protein U-like protein